MDNNNTNKQNHIKKHTIEVLETQKQILASKVKVLNELKELVKKQFPELQDISSKKLIKYIKLNNSKTTSITR